MNGPSDCGGSPSGRTAAAILDASLSLSEELKIALSERLSQLCQEQKIAYEMLLTNAQRN